MQSCRMQISSEWSWHTSYFCNISLIANAECNICLSIKKANVVFWIQPEQNINCLPKPPLDLHFGLTRSHQVVKIHHSIIFTFILDHCEANWTNDLFKVFGTVSITWTSLLLIWQADQMLHYWFAVPPWCSYIPLVIEWQICVALWKLHIKVWLLQFSKASAQSQNSLY